MRNTLKEYLDKLALIRRRQKRTLPVLIGLSALVAFNVTWQMHQTGISMSGEILCELEEHSHSEECYEKVLICDSNDETDAIGSNDSMTAADPDTAADPAAASAEVHVHSLEEGCFTEIQSQTCLEEEHVHEPKCYQEVTNLVCGMEESEEHIHEDFCYQTSQELICVQAEHVHSETCFTTEQVLECSIPEQITQPDQTQPEQMEPALPHIHTEECYEEQLICEEEEHVHSDKCRFANQVDVEDPESWMDGMERYFTGNPRRDLVIAAVHQLGYMESTENVKALDNGDIHGYTRYGHWFGSPYNAWNATFASFVLWQATPGSLNMDESGMAKEVHDQSEHQMVIPFGLTPISWQAKLIREGLWNSVTEENRENPATMIGSVIFLNTVEDGMLEGESIPAGMAKADRVAVVIGVDLESGMLKTVEGEMHGEDSDGNTFKYVGVSQVGIHEPALLGYLMPPELPAREPELVDDFFYTNTFSMETEKEQVEEETEQPAEEEELLEFSFEEYGGISLFSAAQHKYQVVRVTYNSNQSGSTGTITLTLNLDNQPVTTNAYGEPIQNPVTISASQGTTYSWEFLKEDSDSSRYSVTATFNGQNLVITDGDNGKMTSIVLEEAVLEDSLDYMLIRKDAANSGKTAVGINESQTFIDYLNPFPPDSEKYVDGTEDYSYFVWEEGTRKDIPSNGKRTLSIHPKGMKDLKEPLYLTLDGNEQFTLTNDYQAAGAVEIGKDGQLVVNGVSFDDILVYEMFETMVRNFYVYPPLSATKKSEYTAESLPGATFDLYQWYQETLVHPTGGYNYNAMIWKPVASNITSGVNGSINLPQNSSGIFKLKETIAPDGYKTPDEQDYVVFSFQNGVLDIPPDPATILTAGEYGANDPSDLLKGNLIAEADPDTPNKLVIYNNISIVLPETGGEGIAVYLIGGTGLICLSLIGFTRRKLEK